MMTLQEILTYRGAYKVVPVADEMYADVRTPMEVFRIVRNISSHCYILESMEDSHNWGRYTFIGYDPQLGISCRDGQVQIRTGTTVSIKTTRPQDLIQQILEENKAPRIEGMPPFTGGLTGYFSYEFITYAEPSLHLSAEDDEGISDLDLMLFDKVIVFDNLKQKIQLIVNVRLDDAEENYNRACLEIRRMKTLIKDGNPAPENPLILQSEFTPLFSREAYCRMVEKGKQYIHEGDIFQVVLSNRLEAKAKGSLLDTYRVLRTLNPSPYMFFFSGSDVEIAGASPETLTRLQDGKLYTFPLAGSRPRGRNAEEDARLCENLRNNEKELAEHNMLVDLGRNDLGKVSRFGTVCVERYLDIHKYSHIMHLGSTVSGEIQEGKTALDVISAVLPAGTLSGAPKIRACQIIDELEGRRRGIYGGAVRYIDFTGNMDMCIGIRLAYKRNDHVYIRAGAGIVADSVPENEYQECINKAKAVVLAVKEANGGLDNDSAR